MDLSNYTIEELIKLQSQITDAIYSYEDGYLYICEVRSYGRTWTENYIKNKYSLQDLLFEYNGDSGIVDVYSTNPYLGNLQNYGKLMYIESKEDYDNWKSYTTLENLIPSIEKELDEWDDRDNVPFTQRPIFEPTYTRDDLNECKKKLEEFDTSFTPPREYFTESGEIF